METNQDNLLKLFISDFTMSTYCPFSFFFFNPVNVLIGPILVGLLADQSLSLFTINIDISKNDFVVTRIST